MWFRNMLIVLYVLEVVGRIASIGKAREPITQNEAIASMIVNALMIFGVLYYFKPR